MKIDDLISEFEDWLKGMKILSSGVATLFKSENVMYSQIFYFFAA